MDTNVFVAALLQPQGRCAAVLRAWQRSDTQLIVCPELLAELRDVLARPKIQARVDEHEAEKFLSLLRAQAELRADPPPLPGVTGDPKDDHIVALARSTRANFIVSGDEHLAKIAHPPVLKPGDLVDGRPPGASPFAGSPDPERPDPEP